jgi:hypothetical protein
MSDVRPADLLFAVLWNERLSLDGVPVKCSSCGGWFHALTEKFNPLAGEMRGCDLRLLDKYKNFGWYDFPHESWVTGENVQCPQCMVPYRIGEIVAQGLNWAEGIKKERDSGALGETKEEGEAQKAGGGYGSECPLEAVGDLAAPGVNAGEGVVGGARDDSGLSLHERVLKMTWEKYTQADIAKTCEISIYMVREIQNGRKV